MLHAMILCIQQINYTNALITCCILAQFISSTPLLQSSYPSQIALFGIHKLSKHWNSKSVQFSKSGNVVVCIVVVVAEVVAAAG